MKVLIVGGVAGGASAAARARRLSESAQIVMFERGDYVSFANCGLPYHIGGHITDRRTLFLHTPESLRARFNIDVRTRHEVIGIDRENKRVAVKQVGGAEIYYEAYDYLILSPGAHAIIPEIDGLERARTLVLRSVSDMDLIIEAISQCKPRHATVVGGGFIGLEMVEALRARAIEVSLIEAASHVMSGAIDFEMAQLIHRELSAHKVKLHLGTVLQSVRPESAPTYASEAEEDETQGLPWSASLELTMHGGQHLHTDMLILAVGVRADTELARAAGLDVSASGGIIVDDQMRTSDPFILAIGDAVRLTDGNGAEASYVPLAGPAARQGRVAANVIFGRPDRYSGSQGTAICKVFDLAVGSLGYSEGALNKLGRRYQKVYVHVPNHASYYPGAELISLKLIFDPDSGLILGAQAVGKEGVDKRIDVIAVAQRAGMTVEDLQSLELCYAPPYGSARDVVNQAGLVATNIWRGDVSSLHYDQIDAVARERILLDVRNKKEVDAFGTIPNAINIPLNELRDRLDEVPISEKICVFCQVGLRGHVAHRLLLNRGYDVVNLIGGFRTWQLAQPS